MAFSDYSLSLIKRLAADLDGEKNIVCLGYPDMLVHPDLVRELTGHPHDMAMPLRADGAAVLAWHGLQGMDAVVETDWVLRKLGLTPTYLDIRVVRGGERVQDLNEPLAGDLHGKFQIVYDAGTLEHCFNVGQAMRNILDMCAVGGWIYHGNPHNVGNHGFFNFCPTFYHDFYVQNGHEIVGGGCHVLVNGAPAGILPSADRYRLTLEIETWLMAVVRKRHELRSHWPMQTKYVRNPTLEGKGLVH